MTDWIDNWFSPYRPYHIPMAYGTVTQLDGVVVLLIFKAPENFFQAMKIQRPIVRLKISQATPGTAKRMGRQLLLRPDWELIKFEVMLYAQRHKFQPGTPEFDQLMATTGEIVEWNNWHDKIWGRCVCPKCNRQGQNHLGRIITAIRDEHVQKGIVLPWTSTPNLPASCPATAPSA